MTLVGTASSFSEAVRRLRKFTERFGSDWRELSWAVSLTIPAGQNYHPLVFILRRG